MKPLHFARLWLAVGFTMLVTVLVLSLIPLPEQVGNLSDKLQHVIAYAVLGTWFGAIALRSRYLRIAAGLVAFGVAIEFLQRLTGYRNFETRDMLADAVGVCLGLILASTPLGNSLIWLENRLQHG